jgi:hypothetical protein
MRKHRKLLPRTMVILAVLVKIIIEKREEPGPVRMLRYAPK